MSHVLTPSPGPLFQERLEELERREQEEELEEQRGRDNVRVVLSEAERRQLEPIDDSKLVDDVFGFLQPDGAGEAAASQAFGVSMQSFMDKQSD